MQRCNWISVRMNVGRIRSKYTCKIIYDMHLAIEWFLFQEQTRWKCKCNGKEWATAKRRTEKREIQCQMNVDCIKYDDVAIIYCHVNHIFLFMHSKTRSFNPPRMFIFTVSNTSYAHNSRYDSPNLWLRTCSWLGVLYSDNISLPVSYSDVWEIQSLSLRCTTAILIRCFIAQSFGYAISNINERNWHSTNKFSFCKHMMRSRENERIAETAACLDFFNMFFLNFPCIIWQRFNSLIAVIVFVNVAIDVELILLDWEKTKHVCATIVYQKIMVSNFRRTHFNQFIIIQLIELNSKVQFCERYAFYLHYLEEFIIVFIESPKSRVNLIRLKKYSLNSWKKCKLHLFFYLITLFYSPISAQAIEKNSFWRLKFHIVLLNFTETICYTFSKASSSLCQSPS